MSRLVYHDAAERERMYDLMARMRLPFTLALATLIVPAALAVPIYGWTCMTPLAFAVAAYASTDVRLRRLRHPERWVIGTWAFAELMILLMIGLADGPRAYLLAVPIVPMVGVTLIVGRRIALVCAAGLAAALTATAALTMWDEVVALPPVLIAPVSLIFACTLATMGALDGGTVSRRTAMVDPLTGLLNRVALQTRTTELAAQARMSGERVALIVVELDGYAAVCDEHGDAVADAVLAEAGRRLRTEAGSGTVSRFDRATFVVLCPGVTRTSAVTTAERLRAAVGITPIDDVAVTASVGIAVYRGDAFDFAEIFARGIAAVATARDAGGDRVCLAPDEAGFPHLAPAGGDPSGAVSIPADEAWHARLRAAIDPSPLMPDVIARYHAVDSLHRTRNLVRATAVVLSVALVLNASWAGWQIIVPGAIGAVIWEVLGRVVARSRRAEYPAFAGVALVVVACGLSAAVAGPVGLLMLPTVACAILGACSGFPRLGAVLFGALGLIMVTFAGVAAGAAEIAANPVILALPLAYVVGFAVIGEWMGRSAREDRGAGVTDAETGTLNQAALDARIPVLEQLAVDRPISLAVIDLGPGCTRAADAATLMREAVHPFAPLYRVGDAEFVLLLVDVGADTAARAAGRVATAAEEVADDLAVGVAAVPAGDVCSFDELIAAARTAARPPVAGARPRPVLVA